MLRELRHDFRHYYHCAYDDVTTDEAIDLIEALPDGSMYVARSNPLRSWSEERHWVADVIDVIRELTWAVAYDRERMPEPPTVARPRDALTRAKSRRETARTRAEIESGGWEEV